MSRASYAVVMVALTPNGSISHCSLPKGSSSSSLASDHLPPAARGPGRSAVVVHVLPVAKGREASDTAGRLNPSTSSTVLFSLLRPLDEAHHPCESEDVKASPPVINICWPRSCEPWFYATLLLLCVLPQSRLQLQREDLFLSDFWTCWGLTE